MTVIANITILIYILALAYITLYCLLQFHLLYFYKKHHWTNRHQPDARMNGQYPMVTVQLPIYNEKYVVERLIECICNLEYPKDRLEIQVLDDSTDNTAEICQNKVNEYREKGFNIKYIHRTDRSGYKAGALREATPVAQGEFIAIFDADFLPRKDFLLQTLPYFREPNVGVVQTRWEHINEEYSMLTKLQAFQLNVHFTVEQLGRKAGNCMLQFNGTAGVWRKTTIEDAGGWHADTLTEDLDLSYRAQLKGWEIVFLEDIGAPAELPAEINGLKSQQFRWMKGGAETARKMLPEVWRADLSLRQKIHASGHLLASGVFIFVFVAGIISVPMLLAIEAIQVNQQYYVLFLSGLASIIIIYYVANVQAVKQNEPRLQKFFKFLFLFPLFLALSMGLSLHNSIAVLQGYVGKKSPFIRTPKFDIKDLSDSLSQKQYLSKSLNWTTLLEGFLCLYFLGGILLGYYLGIQSFLLFHLLLSIGYGVIFYYSIRQLRIQ